MLCKEHKNSGNRNISHDMGDPWRKHTACPPANQAHHHPIDTGEADPDPATRKTVDVQHSESDCLQQKGCKSGAEGHFQSMHNHPSIGIFLDRCVHHREEHASDDQQSHRQIGKERCQEIVNVRIDDEEPTGECDHRYHY